MTTTAPTVERVLQADNYLGETPLWSAAEEALYWVNCENPPEVHRWRPATGARATWSMPRRVGGIALRPGGRLLVVLADGLYDFDPASAGLTPRCRSPLPEHVALHECQCDRQGRLWVGGYDHNFTPAHRDARDAAFFRLDGDRLTRVVDGISIANGLAFSPDGLRIYFADAPTRRAECADLDPASGEISNRRLFLRLQDGEGFVDGAAIDAEGAYWLAAVGSGALRRYLPDGTLDRIVALPVSNPTKCAFGGANLDVLYVTTTRLAIGPDHEANGGVYAFSPGVSGLPEPVLADAG